MPITFDGQNLTSGMTDPVMMFTVVIILFIIIGFIFVVWSLYNMLG